MKKLTRLLILLISHQLTEVDSKLGDRCVSTAESVLDVGFSCGPSLKGMKNGDTVTEKCVPRHYVCDGFSDCPDNQDEEEFACGSPCPNGEYYRDARAKEYALGCVNSLPTAA